MRTRKPAAAAVCLLLCVLMLTGLAASAFAEEALAELHVEKNGLTLDLSLLKLEIEDGKLVVSVGIDGITKWKDEEPPKIILDFEQAGEKFTSGLFSADTVAKLPENAKNYKTTSKHPVSGEELPDRILIDIGSDEPLVFWEKDPSADAPAENMQTEPPADTERMAAKTTERTAGRTTRRRSSRRFSPSSTAVSITPLLWLPGTARRTIPTYGTNVTRSWRRSQTSSKTRSRRRASLKGTSPSTE